MMDNIRRNNVDELSIQNMPEHEQQQQQHEQEQYKLFGNSGHDGVTYEGPFNVEEVGDEDFRKGLNKLDTVTTVPQLQQKFNKFNIIDEAAINTNTITTTTTTSSKTCVAAAKITTTSTSSSSSSSIKHKTLTQQQQQNTALAKFNRIIDNTVPVTNTYNYQQHVAETLAKNSQQRQHPHYKQQQQQKQQQNQELQEMPILSDSLKRRLATKHHHQYYSNINNINKNTSTDLIVNNSKINFSSSTAATAAVLTSSATIAAAKTDDAILFKQLDVEASTSKAPTAKGLTMLSSTVSATSSQQEQEPETATTSTQKIIGRKSLVEEDEQMERNDVHYLLKQLNSFSDIEEIEIVDMKQKQRQLQEQQQQPEYIREKHFVKADNQQQQQEQQQLEISYGADKCDEQHVEALKQQHVDELKQKQQHVSSEQMLSELHVADTLEQQQEQNFVDVGLPMYTSESKQQHYHSATSPTATSLVIYSPSSQSHKGIRRYASQDEQNAEASYHQQLQQLQYSHHYPYHQPLQQQHPYPPHHHHYLHHQPHYVHLPQEHCSEESMLNYAAAQAAAASASADPLILQQFMDDYIFQSCHYLETNNFVANYRTAMVESSSHEFRPSTTTTNTTRTSNEEFYEEEEAGYVEDHSSAHSFELHETEPPSVICKAPAPAPAPLTASKRQQQELQQFTMETRLCSSGVQTDLTASSLAQSFSLSSSSSSSDKQKRRQPLFKCCYTPLDRWREKRSQQSQIQKRTKSATNTTTTTVKFADKPIEYHAPQEPQHMQHQTQQFQQISTKNTKVAIVGGPSSSVCTTTIVNSCMTTSTNATATATLVVQPQTHLPPHPQFHSQHTPHTHHHIHHTHHSQTLSKNNNNNNKNIKNNAPYAV